MTRKLHAFSLIELLVALAILAAVTTVAIRSVDGLQSQARYQQTTRNLDEIRSAIVGPANLRGPDGSPLITGFVADTGRLPNYFVSPNDPYPLASRPGDPLNELLERNSLPAFNFVQSNSDPNVLIGVGWKGPYIRLGAGPTYLRDGWGNSFHVYLDNGNPTTANNPIAQIVSWGADNVLDANHGGPGDTIGYNSDVSLPNAVNLTTGGFVTGASFFGRVSMNIGPDAVGTSGPNPNITYTPPTPTSPLPPPLSTHPNVAIWVSYFGPDLTATPRPVIEVCTQVDPATWQYRLTDPKITIGPRVLKAYVVDASVVTDVSTFKSKMGSTPDPIYGPVYFISTMNLTATPGAQVAPTLVLPHYQP